MPRSDNGDGEAIRGSNRWAAHVDADRAAGLAELHGIGNEVDQDLPDGALIGHRRPGLHRIVDLDG